MKEVCFSNVAKMKNDEECQWDIMCANWSNHVSRYRTECAKKHYIICFDRPAFSDPEKNGFRFCPNCGKKPVLMKHKWGLEK